MKCRHCNTNLIQTFVDLGSSPPSNSYLTNETIKKAFQITEKHGLKRFSFNIVGLPFETKKMAKDTLNLNLELRANFGKCFYFYPYPGTRLHKLCSDYNLALEENDSVSGYLEKPSLKELFMSHQEMRKQAELMNLFFYARLLFSKIKIPLFLEKFLIRIIFLFRKPILIILNPGRDSKIKKLAKKYLR